jgi:hypothetical protein
MNGLSASGLADLAGTTTAEVQRLVEFGILVARDGTGPFLEADVQKVRLAVACEQAGLPMEAIASAIRAGRLSFAFLEASPFRRWAVRSGRTYRQVSQETEIPLDTLGAVLESMGFARAAPDEPMREDELAVVPLLQLALSSGTFDLAWVTRRGCSPPPGPRPTRPGSRGRRWLRGRQRTAMELAAQLGGDFLPLGTRRCWASTAASKSWRRPSISSSASRTSSRRPACWDGQSGSRRCRSLTWWATPT